MKQSKFRYLNEMLYTQPSTDAEGAVLMFMKDQSTVSDYHEGYRQQVEKWPKNPLDIFISELSKMDKYENKKIADFGCGEGKLALQLMKAGHPKENIYSFDAGKLDGPEYEHITQSDIANVPLKGQSIDVVVFCLSLMGTNFPKFLLEANRVLKSGGTLFIAEVLSRFTDVSMFSDTYMFKYCGFKVLKMQKLKDFFYVMVYKKVRDRKFITQEENDEFAEQLKPCLYKKR